MGIFKIPYGWEVLQSDADRPFIERSWWEQNITPGEFDTGAKAYTTALDSRLTVQVAVINGNIQGEKTFSLLPDLNKGKDLVGRAQLRLRPVRRRRERLLRPGAGGRTSRASPSSSSPATRGTSRRRSTTGSCHIGETRVFAEFDRGQNMDRGTKYSAAIALPGLPTDIANGSVVNKDEIGYWVRLEQDITRWVTLAARYDVYSPDTAQGTTINGRQTEAFVGVVHFTKALQLMNEYDHFTDNVHIPGQAIPYKQGDMFSTVFQVRFP